MLEVVQVSKAYAPTCHAYHANMPRMLQKSAGAIMAFANTRMHLIMYSVCNIECKFGLMERLRILIVSSLQIMLWCGGGERSSERFIRRGVRRDFNFACPALFVTRFVDSYACNRKFSCRLGKRIGSMLRMHRGGIVAS